MVSNAGFVLIALEQLSQVVNINTFTHLLIYKWSTNLFWYCFC